MLNTTCPSLSVIPFHMLFAPPADLLNKDNVQKAIACHKTTWMQGAQDSFILIVIACHASFILIVLAPVKTK